MQMRIEQEENRYLKEYLELTYKLAIDHVLGKWEYVSPSEQEDEVERRKLVNDG